jgi:DNA-binding transcriptional regulator YbjK
MASAVARTQSKPSKPSRPRGAARREALLQATLKIVGEVGADAVTHRRVAEAAGLPLASTTYYFDSKEHLLTAALQYAACEDQERLAQFVAQAPADRDPLDLAVEAILGPADPAMPSSRGALITCYALLLEAARRPALRQIASDWSATYRDALGTLMARAGSADPGTDGVLLLAAADGLLIDQLASGSSADLAPCLRRVATALVAHR